MRFNLTVLIIKQQKLPIGNWGQLRVLGRIVVESNNYNLDLMKGWCILQQMFCKLQIWVLFNANMNIMMIWYLGSIAICRLFDSTTIRIDTRNCSHWQFFLFYLNFIRGTTHSLIIFKLIIIINNNNNNNNFDGIKWINGLTGLQKFIS